MKKSEVLSKVDHTFLKPTATWEDIRKVCEEGIRYQCASVCIPPCYVKQAAEYVNGRLRIGTVIGFPNGYSTTASKCYEAAEAVANGAAEVDMVINIGWLKAGALEKVEEEIRAVKEACSETVLKVIIETCLLTEQEKIRMCQIVSRSGADYIKTSTGFSKAGATPEDVALFAAHIEPWVKIKAAGGISGWEDAERFIELGASRLGTSRIVSLMTTPEEGK